MGSSYMDPLLSSPHLQNMRVCDLSEVALEQSTVEILLSAPNLASIERLLVGFEYRTSHDPEETNHRLKSRFGPAFRG